MTNSRGEIIEKARKLEQFCRKLEERAVTGLAKANSAFGKSENPEEEREAKADIELNDLRKQELRNIRHILLEIINGDRKLDLEIMAELTEMQRKRLAKLRFNPNSAGEHEFARKYKPDS